MHGSGASRPSRATRSTSRSSLPRCASTKPRRATRSSGSSSSAVWRATASGLPPPNDAVLFLDNGGSTDPTLNLALEEYALVTLDLSDSYVLFYVNRPSIIVGKHQNTIEEIDADFVDERGIAVIRRISGGGAVYHDLGNLSFSF